MSEFESRWHSGLSFPHLAMKRMTSQCKVRVAKRTRYPLLLSGVVNNFLMGVMYGWGILLAPLEGFLDLPRSALSIVPGIGLMCFTLGVYVHDPIARRMSPSVLAPLVVLVAGAGHFLFFLLPGYMSLLLGPGVIFGTAAGIGYGLSIAYAQAACRKNEGLAVGIVVASFAASGMALSAVAVTTGISQAQIPNLFGILALIYLVVSPLLWKLLNTEDARVDQNWKDSAGSRIAMGKPFLGFGIAFFAFCYIGLMIMSHGVAILRELGAADHLSVLAPFVLNSGYLVGALLGGVFVERSSPKMAPMIGLSVLLLGLLALNAGFPVGVWIVAILVLGVGFGSTVTMFVTLLAYRYGSANAGFLFGRLNVGYGLAGLTAPSITGLLYDFGGSYRLPILAGTTFGALGLFALVASRSSDKATVSEAAGESISPAVHDTEKTKETRHITGANRNE